MTHKPVFAAFAAIMTVGLMGTVTATSAAAASTPTAGQSTADAPGGLEPGWDHTYIVDVCPFAMKVRDQIKWFKEVVKPNGFVDYDIDATDTFTNLDTGKTWTVKGSSVTHWIFKEDGSLTQTVSGVAPAYGPLHTVYYGVWTRTFPDGAPGPVPFTGVGKTVDICQQLS